MASYVPISRNEVLPQLPAALTDQTFESDLEETFDNLWNSSSQKFHQSIADIVRKYESIVASDPCIIDLNNFDVVSGNIDDIEIVRQSEVELYLNLDTDLERQKLYNAALHKKKNEKLDRSSCNITPEDTLNLRSKSDKDDGNFSADQGSYFLRSLSQEKNGIVPKKIAKPKVKKCLNSKLNSGRQKLSTVTSVSRKLKQNCGKECTGSSNSTKYVKNMNSHCSVLQDTICSMPRRNRIQSNCSHDKKLSETSLKRKKHFLRSSRSLFEQQDEISVLSEMVDKQSPLSNDGIRSDFCTKTLVVSLKRVVVAKASIGRNQMTEICPDTLNEDHSLRIKDMELSDRQIVLREKCDKTSTARQKKVAIRKTETRSLEVRSLRQRNQSGKVSIDPNQEPISKKSKTEMMFSSSEKNVVSNQYSEYCESAVLETSQNPNATNVKGKARPSDKVMQSLPNLEPSPRRLWNQQEQTVTIEEPSSFDLFGPTSKKSKTEIVLLLPESTSTVVNDQISENLKQGDCSKPEIVKTSRKQISTPVGVKKDDVWQSLLNKEHQQSPLKAQIKHRSKLPVEEPSSFDLFGLCSKKSKTKTILPLPERTDKVVNDQISEKLKQDDCSKPEIAKTSRKQISTPVGVNEDDTWHSLLNKEHQSGPLKVQMKHKKSLPIEEPRSFYLFRSTSTKCKMVLSSESIDCNFVDRHPEIVMRVKCDKLEAIPENDLNDISTIPTNGDSRKATQDEVWQSLLNTEHQNGFEEINEHSSWLFAARKSYSMKTSKKTHKQYGEDILCRDVSEIDALTVGNKSHNSSADCEKAFSNSTVKSGFVRKDYAAQLPKTNFNILLDKVAVCSTLDVGKNAFLETQNSPRSYREMKSLAKSTKNFSETILDPPEFDLAKPSHVNKSPVTEAKSPNCGKENSTKSVPKDSLSLTKGYSNVPLERSQRRLRSWKVSRSNSACDIISPYLNTKWNHLGSTLQI